MTITKNTSNRYALPFGTKDLTSELIVDNGPPRRVRCYVRGCQHFLRVPTRIDRGDVCPEHGIRCHHSGGSVTYSYADPARNIIASPDTFKEKIVGHPFKFESHRLGLERSEDALSWNVFRSLEQAELLHEVAAMVTGQTINVQPLLFLWGICTTDDSFEPWDLLIAARQRFESNLPVKRPLTEPDIALFLPGRYLILIEAKFTSANTFYDRGTRANASSLTLSELKQIYQSPDLKTLDYEKANQADRIYYQLWRNMIFAEWMAHHDHPKTEPYHVNLVCEGQEISSARHFKKLLRPALQYRFQRLTWEQIHSQVQLKPAASTLSNYMQTKTAGLRRVFKLPA